MSNERDAIIPAKPRQSHLYSDSETRRILLDISRWNGFEINHDREAGVFKVWNERKQLVMRGIQKGHGGPWIVTASNALTA